MPVLSHIALRLDSDDRIALLGSNGNGKSTLAKLIAGRLKPLSGEMVLARKLVAGYFAQHQLDELDAEKSALETLWAHRPLFDLTTARTRLGGFGFSGDKAETKVSSLSGGERARLLLAIATLDKPNLLILDEPTNHLDIDAREELLAALNDYEGAVVLISHDRRLIEGCADRLLLVANGRATPYDGDDYRRLVLSASAEEPSAREARGPSRVDARREEAQRRQALKPLKDAMARAERDIAKHQADIAAIDQSLAAPGLFAKDPKKGEALSKQRAEAVRALDAAEARWMEAAETYETATKD
jgi:ATP-binding cassette subfamily F protein 3